MRCRTLMTWITWLVSLSHDQYHFHVTNIIPDCVVMSSHSQQLIGWNNLGGTYATIAFTTWSKENGINTQIFGSYHFIIAISWIVTVYKTSQNCLSKRQCVWFPLCVLSQGQLDWCESSVLSGDQSDLSRDTLCSQR